jgi:hypothetical protein
VRATVTVDRPPEPGAEPDVAGEVGALPGPEPDAVAGPPARGAGVEDAEQAESARTTPAASAAPERERRPLEVTGTRVGHQGGIPAWAWRMPPSRTPRREPVSCGGGRVRILGARAPAGAQAALAQSAERFTRNE